VKATIAAPMRLPPLAPIPQRFGNDVKHFHFASVGFQPAGQHLSATNAKSSQSDRSSSDASGGEQRFT